MFKCLAQKFHCIKILPVKTWNHKKQSVLEKTRLPCFYLAMIWLWHDDGMVAMFLDHHLFHVFERKIGMSYRFFLILWRALEEIPRHNCRARKIERTLLLQKGLVFICINQTSSSCLTIYVVIFGNFWTIGKEINFSKRRSGSFWWACQHIPRET